MEKAQIKWVLFSGVISLAAIGYRLATYVPNVPSWTDYLLTVALMSLVVSIANAILRYRLYDIDIIIRRTVQDVVFTAVLLLIYFGSVTLLQSALTGLTGSQSPLVIVLPTLLIAALFNPFRRAVQAFIDRRFYRRRYDAAQALAQFSKTAQDEVDKNELTMAFLEVVGDTMEPESVNLWLSDTS